jgi:hypothetical protein
MRAGEASLSLSLSLSLTHTHTLSLSLESPGEQLSKRAAAAG